MYCQKCGKEILNGDKYCINCGIKIEEIENKVSYEGQFKNYLGLSIVGIIFCIPLGVVALLASVEVEKYAKKGDLVNAEKSSKRAKTFGIMGIAIGIPLNIIIIILRIVSLCLE